MSDAVSELLVQVRAEVNDSVATLAWAWHGMMLAAEMIERQPVSPENPNPRLIQGHGNPNSSDAAILAEWRRDDTLARLRFGGRSYNRMGRDWVIALYQTWDEDLRVRLASAAGVPAGRVLSDVFGDLRLIRNDVVHKQGRASVKHAASARVLDWFEVDDEIAISPHHLKDFIEKLGEYPIRIEDCQYYIA